MHPSRFTPAARLLAPLVLVASTSTLALAQGTPPQTAAKPAQAAPAPQGTLSEADIKALAAIHLAISARIDSTDAELALASNKKLESQQLLRDQMREKIAVVLQKNGLTMDEFNRRRFLISSDAGMRKTFDAAIAQITGAPLVGTLAPAPAANTAAARPAGAAGSPAGGAPSAAANAPGGGTTGPALPAGAVGVHLGHILNSFGDTPDKSGLLPMALAEARTASQHAALAVKASANLAMMKTHAGHIINALDPSIEPKGPGKGYGVKKASQGVANHIELAAKAEGASGPVKTHAMHIATAARATDRRADRIIEMAKKIQAATTAEEAAKLAGEMAALCDQLTNGADLNNDGKQTWEGDEGGLQQVQQHVDLLLKAAR